MLNKILREELKKTGKPAAWFRFAVKNKTGGWRFLNGKEAQWRELNRVAKKAAGKLPGYTQGEIVDRLAAIVNG
jgi:hypothetical protein